MTTTNLPTLYKLKPTIDMELMRLYKSVVALRLVDQRVDQRVQRNHFPRQYLNVNQFTFSCSPGISGMRYTWLMYTSDFL